MIKGFFEERKAFRIGSVGIIIYFIFISSLLFAQTERDIKGRVSGENGKPLSDVYVKILDTSRETKTLPDGSFLFENIKPDNYLLLFAHPDYISQSVAVNMTEAQLPLLQVSLRAKNPMVLTIKEEITVTAEADSIIDVKLPSHRTIMPSSVVEELGTANVAETVEKVPGVALVGKGGYSMVPAIRGLAEHRILMLVDGVRITSERRIGVSASFINLSDIDRIEVNRGPYSVFHGSGALGGIINVITKSPAPYSPFRGEFQLSYNTVREERAGSLHLSGSLGRFGFLFGLSGKKAGDYSSPNGKILQSRYSDHNLFFKVNRETERSQFYITLFDYNGSDIGKPSPEAWLKPRWYPSENNTFLTIGYKLKDALSLDSFNASLYILRSSLETMKENLTSSMAVSKRNEAFVGGTNFGFKLRAGKKVADIHSLNFGMDFFGRGNIDDRNTEWRYDSSGSLSNQTSETSLNNAREHNIGFYLDDKIQITSPLSLNLGARFDYISNSNYIESQRFSRSDQAFTMYLGSIYQVSPYFSILANIGRSFRFPSVSELFYSGLTGRGTVFGNPELKPETSINMDLGFRYFHEKFFVSLYGFSNSISDMIQKFGDVAAEEYSYKNLSRGRITGFEGELYLSLARDWEIFINFHHMTGKDKEGKPALNYIPPTRMTLWTKFSRGKFWLEPRISFSDKVDNPGPLEIEIDGFILLDTILGLKINKDLTLLCIAQNLLNQTYRFSADVDGVDAPGRGFVFKASYGF